MHISDGAIVAQQPSHKCPDNELGWQLELIHGLAATQVFHHMARTMHAVDLSFSQLIALFSLCRLGPQSITALAGIVHLSHAAASRMVEKLVKEKLVLRSQNPDNRREKLVRITPKALGYLQELQAATARAYSDLLQPAPHELRERLWRVLEQIKPQLPLQYREILEPPETPGS